VALILKDVTVHTHMLSIELSWPFGN